MTQSKLIVVGWTIFFSTFSLAAPKTKLGAKAYPYKGKAQYQARQQTPKKVFRPKSKGAAEQSDSGELGSMDTVVYQAQKFASEMTQEVGYLLKATGPWLKEIEDQIRGVDNSAPVTVQRGGSRTLASNKASAATKVAPAPSKTPGFKTAALPSSFGKKNAPRRQLGEMSANPNQIMETITAFSKDTWDKVQSLVSDLMASSDE